MPREIANTELTEQDLPPPDADEVAMWRFARTFDGYRYIESKPPIPSGHLVAKLGALANSARGDYFKSGKVALPKTLADLRACLFFEWRRLHHQDISADREMMAYLNALVASIRQKVRAGKRDQAE
jgi:hypothetical protein